MKTYLITGGAGFIGCNFIKLLLKKYNDIKIICLDKLTYAGNLENLSDELNDNRFTFVRGDITDQEIVQNIFKENINYVINFAAESHVDRSITDPQIFLKTNILGTQNLLNVTKTMWETSEDVYKDDVKFIQISTDEVYGSLNETGSFTEKSCLNPCNPYSAAKASADLLVNAYINTYKFPAIITRCSNNYGPYQFPEKLIPLVINNILNKKNIPVYGDGSNIRDWVHVNDHCNAIDIIINKGTLGQVYNIGGDSEVTNLELVKTIIDEIKENTNAQPDYSLIKFIKDRKGHDKRYSINFSKIKSELNWTPEIDFDKGIKSTIKWYLDNNNWIKNIISKDYQEYYEKHYGGKL
jgi:dTDP-glucose 4,6-dehydratase